MTVALKEENTAPAPSHKSSQTDNVEINTEINIQAIIPDYSSGEDEEAIKPSSSTPIPKPNCQNLRKRLRSSASVVTA
ncbi:hypothetical protein BPOR_0733g00010 [Botrytis porri]|uniref:Uncharacterized protein n=1 Tax=Botrytis porri TaxID=87229 RepID=A0A4Z1KNZ0_9HELO|nr:hypothetical protein BPOR_0733g00010 [Botrytis porri]